MPKIQNSPSLNDATPLSSTKLHLNISGKPGVIFNIFCRCGLESNFTLPILNDGRAALTEPVYCGNCTKDHTAQIIRKVENFNKDWIARGAPAARLQIIRDRMNDVKIDLYRRPELHNCYEVRFTFERDQIDAARCGAIEARRFTELLVDKVYEHIFSYSSKA
jgi:hypothetical protein